MSDAKDKNYIAVDIRSFRNSSKDIRFDVYIKLSTDNFAHVFSKSTGLDYRRLAQYIQKGIQDLYIRFEDKPLFDEMLKNNPDHILADPSASPEAKITTLLSMTEQNIAELFTYANVNPETAEKTQQIVRRYVDMMVSDPKSLALVLKLISHGEYLYYHSVAVSIFSMFIAKASGQFNQRTLEIVGLGGFLHDIGCTHVPEDVLNYPGGLSEEQWKEIREHPKLGLKMLEGNSGIPDEVRYIVYQHHEQPDGEGYPNKLHSPVIYYPAKIVALADAFSALIAKRPWREAFTVEKAIETLLASPGKYDRKLVEFLSSNFGPAKKKAA